MATHSWRIPWAEELGGLQSTGRKKSDTTERLHFVIPMLRPNFNFSFAREYNRSCANRGPWNDVVRLWQEERHVLQVLGWFSSPAWLSLSVLEASNNHFSGSHRLLLPEAYAQVCFLAYMADHSFGIALAHLPYPEHNSSMDKSNLSSSEFLNHLGHSSYEPVPTQLNLYLQQYLENFFTMWAIPMTQLQTATLDSKFIHYQQPAPLDQPWFSTREVSFSTAFCIYAPFLSNKVRIWVLGGYGESFKHLISPLSTLHQPQDSGHFLHVSLLYPSP